VLERQLDVTVLEVDEAIIQWAMKEVILRRAPRIPPPGTSYTPCVPWNVEKVKVVEFHAYLAHPLLREIASNASEILEVLIPRKALDA
jgi:hypothetical protein